MDRQLKSMLKEGEAAYSPRLVLCINLDQYPTPFIHFFLLEQYTTAFDSQYSQLWIEQLHRAQEEI